MVETMHAKTRVAIALLLLLAEGALMCSPSPASATLGVGVTARSIRLEEALRPGESCKVGSVGVANTGDQPATYDVLIQPAFVRGRRDAPPAWFRIAPARVDPGPTHIEYVEVTLHVPRDAAPGTYAGILAAMPRLSGEATATRLNIVAGTLVYFSVSGQPAPVEADAAPVTRSASYGWWVLYAGGAVALLALLSFVSRNLRISVHWGRKSD